MNNIHTVSPEHQIPSYSDWAGTTDENPYDAYQTTLGQPDIFDEPPFTDDSFIDACPWGYIPF